MTTNSAFEAFTKSPERTTCPCAKGQQTFATNGHNTTRELQHAIATPPLNSEVDGVCRPEHPCDLGVSEDLHSAAVNMISSCDSYDSYDGWKCGAV